MPPPLWPNIEWLSPSSSCSSVSRQQHKRSRQKVGHDKRVWTFQIHGIGSVQLDISIYQRYTTVRGVFGTPWYLFSLLRPKRLHHNHDAWRYSDHCTTVSGLKSAAVKKRPTLSWLWTNRLLVIALSRQHILDELNIQVSSGSACIDDINVQKLDGKISGGALRIQYSSCKFATFSVANSSISSKSLGIKEECSISASSSRVTLVGSHQPENGYRVKSINGSLLLGSRRLSGTVAKGQFATPLYVIESDVSRVEIL